MSDFNLLIEKAKHLHGGLCAGIVLGTRMTIAGLKALGLDPFQQNCNLIVYAEIDRCMADAIQAITGCSLGHRTLKYTDYGKFGATFLDMSTSKAVRLSVSGSPHERVLKDGMEAAVEIFSKMPEHELLRLQEVRVKLSEKDMPGKPRYQTVCARCGESVFDGREVVVDGKPLCRACVNGPYYKVVSEKNRQRRKKP